MQIIYVPLTSHVSQGLVVTATPSIARDELISNQRRALIDLEDALGTSQIIFSDKLVTSEGTFAVFILQPVLQPVGG